MHLHVHVQCIDMIDVTIVYCLTFPVQVHCSVPPSTAEREMKMIEETVAAECCPETLRRIRETGAQVVRLRRVCVCVCVCE